MELRYLRDMDKREVDLVVLKHRKPLFGLERKIKNESFSKYFLLFGGNVKSL